MIDPGLAEGRSRLMLFVGVLGLVAAAWTSTGPLAWAGLVVVAAAFALNTAGKVVHYHELPIGGRERRLLVATWTFQSVLVVAFLVQLVALRYGGGDGSFFWSLAIGATGFALLHRGAQNVYLDDIEPEDVNANGPGDERATMEGAGDR